VGIFDNAKDMIESQAGDFDISDLKSLDLGAIADRARAAGFDPEQLKGLLSRFTGPDGKLDLNSLLAAAKSLGLDVDRLRGLIGR
jgi:hypothetical protein